MPISTAKSQTDPKTTSQATPASTNALRAALNRRADTLGLIPPRITNPAAIGQAGERLEDFLAAGYHGTMTWLGDKSDKRKHPNALWPEAKSIIMTGINYGPTSDPLDALAHKSNGTISVYAKGRDYHDVLKGKLKHLAQDVQRLAGGDVKVFVDTAPLMEKPLAAAAGIGWQGKHTNLVSQDAGSWLLLGAILSTADLEPDPPSKDHCGSCSRCLDVCPTDAFPAPYKLDARRCIAYLTIEYKGHIPEEFRRPIGNRIYGCDDCLAVCPWNKFASESKEAKFAASKHTDNPPLADLLALDDAAFRKAYAGSPIKRTGRDSFIRNCLIAAGNAEDTSLLPAVIPHLADPSPIVRAMAVWALRRLTDKTTVETHRDVHAATEHDADVRHEWTKAHHA